MLRVPKLNRQPVAAAFWVIALTFWFPAIGGDMAGVKEIVGRILENMEKRDRAQLGGVAMVVDESPAIYPRRGTNAVLVSQAFVEFVDKFAQALAAEKFSPGYVKSLGAQLCQNDGSKPFGPLPEAPTLPVDKMAFTNARETFFGDIVAGSLAIEFAHLFLDQYGPHQKQLAALPPETSVKTVLTENEWEKAIKRGVITPAKCGYGIDGLAAFYETLDGLAPRPAWADHYIPPKTPVAKVRKLLISIRDKAS
jgi:hypothetical protein